MALKITVIVTTYNQPRELELVLHALMMQSYQADEILIADDGSKAETAAIINRWSKESVVPIKHVWHEDEGNRKLKICNKAATLAQGNYLIFLDGDAIPQRHWIADHFTASRAGTVLCGRRVRLGPKISQKIDAAYIKSNKLENLFGELFFSALKKDTKRFMLGIRLPSLLARSLHINERRLMGVNFSLHKDLFQQIGGYPDEANKYYREDAHLEIQLINAGVKRYPLLNRAIVYHLYHPESIPNKDYDHRIQTNYESALQARKMHLQK